MRAAIARWLERRFGLPAAAIDAESMVLPVNGTREALFAFAQGVVDSDRPSPAVLMPSYSEIYADEAQPPPGLLQASLAAGRSAFERCMVFHSLSKRSSVPGLRSGFVAGDPRLIEGFRLYRTYHGCAVPVHTQRASLPAWQDEAHVRENRRLYREKFAAVVPLLGEAFEVESPAGGFYLWPAVGDDEAFARGLFEQQHVTVLPGSYLARDTAAGNPGRGRVRISLVAGAEDCEEAARRIVRYCRTSRAANGR